jgi:hypothetical protein
MNINSGMRGIAEDELIVSWDAECGVRRKTRKVYPVWFI